MLLQKHLIDKKLAVKPDKKNKHFESKLKELNEELSYVKNNYYEWEFCFRNEMSKLEGEYVKLQNKLAFSTVLRRWYFESALSLLREKRKDRWDYYFSECEKYEEKTNKLMKEINEVGKVLGI